MFNRINKITGIVFFVLIITKVVYNQEDNRALATIGNEVITVEDFKNRFEFMPHLNYSSTNIDSIKKEFLYSLVAEKLWALEADELNIDTLETIILSLKSLENLFVRDELYKHEVESKINIANEEIAKGISRVNRILSTNIIISSDSVEIWGLYNTLQKNADFDSILSEINLPKKKYDVKFGSLEDEKIEDAVFSLNKNEISKPLKFNNNWFIFKLIDEKQDSVKELTLDHAKNIVLSTLKNNKAQILGRKFVDGILGGKKILADKMIFDQFCSKLFELLSKKTNDSIQDSINGIQLGETDILNLLSALDKSILNDAFVKFDDRPATLKDFMSYLIYQKVYFDSLNLTVIKTTLNNYVKQFIENEAVAREGYKRSFAELPSVKNELKIWKNYYLAEVLMNSLSDSIKISENEINNLVQSEDSITGNNLQVNIIEILTDKLSEVEEILNKLNEGKDFEYLASIYNKRKWTQQSNGEWGFFDANRAGEIGKIASELEVGKIYGPLKVPEGYSIFKVIAKKEKEIPNPIQDNNENKKFVKIKLALQKMDDLINKKTVSLADKYNIKVNENLLKTFETSELNTFTYRLIGFGGKIAAFPITIPMYEWYNQYKQRTEIP